MMDSVNNGSPAGGDRMPVSGGTIPQGSLNTNRYTLSLLREGQRAGLLRDRVIADFPYKLLLILRQLINRHTQGESSSVPTDLADGILASILYTLDAYLLHLGDHREAIAALQSTDVAELYERGVERLRLDFEATKARYREMRASKLDVPIDAYNLTIEESLPVFLRKYNILFEAHNTMASIDYPLAHDDMRLQGIAYVKQYVERLQLENAFCRQFDREDLLRLLEQYGRVCRFDYRIELFNLFELVLHQAVFALLSGGEARRIIIAPYQFDHLVRSFTGADATEIGAWIRAAMNRLKRELQLDAGTAAYMKPSGQALVRRIVNAAAHGSFQPLIVTGTAARTRPVSFAVDPNAKMSDARLRQLLDDIARTESIEGKIRIVRTHFASLHDYLDLLESGTLYGDEYLALYEAMSDVEHAILAKIVCYEELRGGDTDLPAIVSGKRGAEAEWQAHWLAYVRGLSDGRLRELERLMDEIDYEGGLTRLE